MNTQLNGKLPSRFRWVSGIISFALLALNLGLSNDFAVAWLRSRAIDYGIVIPAILLLGPRLQAHVDRLVR